MMGLHGRAIPLTQNRFKAYSGWIALVALVAAASARKQQPTYLNKTVL